MKTLKFLKLFENFIIMKSYEILELKKKIEILRNFEIKKKLNFNFFFLIL